MARPKKIVEEKKVVRRGRPKKATLTASKMKKIKTVNIDEVLARLDKLESRVNDIDADLNDLFKDVEDATKSNSRSKEDDIKELLDLFAKSKKVTKPEPVAYVYVSTRRYF